MSEEKEIKLMLSEGESGWLEKLSNQLPLVSSKAQTDYYYDNEDYFFTQRDRGLRVRFVNSIPIDFTFKALFYFPNRKPNPWYVEEHAFKLPTSEIKPIQTIFERFDLKFATEKKIVEYSDIQQNFVQNKLSPKIVIEKHRKTFTYKDAEVIWDDVKNLGSFIEIETQKSSPQKIAQELGLENVGKQTMEGYAALMYQKLGLPEMKKKEPKYQKNPHWNVFEKEKKIYEKLAIQTEK